MYTFLLAAADPPFDAEGSPSASYEANVIIWSRVANLGPGGKMAALVLRMTDVARRPCETSRTDHVVNTDGAQQILRIACGHFALHAAVAIYPEVVLFMDCKRADQTLHEYLVEFGVLGHKAGARVVGSET